jgi:hypothetical protein
MTFFTSHYTSGEVKHALVKKALKKRYTTMCEAQIQIKHSTPARIVFEW